MPSSSGYTVLDMGYNLYARCLDHNVSAFVYRGNEAEAIREWYDAHPRCRSEWAVDNNHDAPDWVESETDIELPARMAGHG